MGVMTPTPKFAAYVQDAISVELSRPQPSPKDVIESRLWAAAQYDHHTKQGAICSMLDGLGLALVDSSEYETIIKRGLFRITESGF